MNNIIDSFIERLFGKPKVKQVYYKRRRDGTYSTYYTEKVYFLNGMWYISLKDKFGNKVYNFPYDELEIDRFDIVLNKRFI